MLRMVGTRHRMLKLTMFLLFLSPSRLVHVSTLYQPRKALRMPSKLLVQPRPLAAELLLLCHAGLVCWLRFLARIRTVCVLTFHPSLQCCVLASSILYVCACKGATAPRDWARLMSILWATLLCAFEVPETLRRGRASTHVTRSANSATISTSEATSIEAMAWRMCTVLQLPVASKSHEAGTVVRPRPHSFRLKEHAHGWWCFHTRTGEPQRAQASTQAMRGGAARPRQTARQRSGGKAFSRRMTEMMMAGTVQLTGSRLQAQ